jgi:hypothetical protein
MRQKTGKFPTPAVVEVSSYMRSLVEKRWKLYTERVARGEITADNYAYRPLGPLPWNLKSERDLKRLNRQITNALLVRFALEGRKLSRRQIEQMVQATLSPKRRRLHLRFGGQQPKQWHSLHHDRLMKNATKEIRAELGLDAKGLPKNVISRPVRYRIAVGPDNAESERGTGSFCRKRPVLPWLWAKFQRADLSPGQ